MYQTGLNYLGSQLGGILSYQPVFFLKEGKLVQKKKPLYLYRSKYWLILDNTSYIGKYQVIWPTSENHLVQRYKGKKQQMQQKHVPEPTLPSCFRSPPSRH